MIRPRLLLLDEPTASLAPMVTDQIFTKIPEINDKDVAIVLVEQNVKQSLQVASRGFVLVGCRKVLEAPAEDLLKREDLGAIFLGKD